MCVCVCAQIFQWIRVNSKNQPIRIWNRFIRFTEIRSVASRISKKAAGPIRAPRQFGIPPITRCHLGYKFATIVNTWRNLWDEYKWWWHMVMWRSIDAVSTPFHNSNIRRTHYPPHSPQAIRINFHCLSIDFESTSTAVFVATKTGENSRNPYSLHDSRANWLWWSQFKIELKLVFRLESRCLHLFNFHFSNIEIRKISLHRPLT